MFRPVRFPLALPVVLGAVLVASPGRGQPPAGKKGDDTPARTGAYDIKPAPGGEHLEPIKPYYTAFPDLRPAETKEVKDTDGTTRLEYVGEVPLPPLPVLGADAPALKKVQLEQLKAGLRYRLRIREVIRIGSWTSQFFLDYLTMISETFRVAAELEEKPAARVPWFEARVRAFKEIERFTYDRVIEKRDPPQRFDQAQFNRFQAEAALLRLKAEVDFRVGCAPVPPLPAPICVAPPRMPVPVNPFAKEGPPGIRPPPGAGPELAIRQPPYTAFPDLRPVETKLVKNPDGTTRPEYAGDVPLPPLPVLGADAPSLKKVQLEQLNAGLRYCARIREVIRLGSWTSQFFLDALVMFADTYRVAAELEDRPAARVQWLEARVRTLKEVERFTYDRVLEKSDPPQRFDQAQFARLQTEADLIRLKAEVENGRGARGEPTGGSPPGTAKGARGEPAGGSPPGTAAAPVPPLRMPDPVNPFPKEAPKVDNGPAPGPAPLEPPFTAFPDLRPVELKRVKTPNGDWDWVYRGEVPLPPLPVLRADASALKKVQLEQLKAGLRYRARIREVIRIGSWTSQFYLDYLVMCAETYRVAAELEDKPAARVPWYEARVRTLKEHEHFQSIRITSSSEPSPRIDHIKFARLQAEADLIRLKAEVANAGK